MVSLRWTWRKQITRLELADLAWLGLKSINIRMTHFLYWLALNDVIVGNPAHPTPYATFLWSLAVCNIPKMTWYHRNPALKDQSCSPYLWLEGRRATWAAFLLLNVPTPSYSGSHGGLLYLLCYSSPCLVSLLLLLVSPSSFAVVWLSPPFFQPRVASRLLLFGVLSPHMNRPRGTGKHATIFLFLLAAVHQIVLTEKGSHHMTEAFH